MLHVAWRNEMLGTNTLALKRELIVNRKYVKCLLKFVFQLFALLWLVLFIHKSLFVCGVSATYGIVDTSEGNMEKNCGNESIFRTLLTITSGSFIQNNSI